MKKQFQAIIQQIDKRVAIALPFDPNQFWGEKERHDVTGTVNGIQIRGPLFQESGACFLTLGPAWLRDSQVEVGDEVAVVLEAEGPQIAQMADDLQAAFAAAPTASAFFNSLATFYRKNYMRWVDGAKRPETRSKRIAEMIALLQNEQRER